MLRMTLPNYSSVIASCLVILRMRRCQNSAVIASCLVKLSLRRCQTTALSLYRAWSCVARDVAKLQPCHCVVPGHASPKTLPTYRGVIASCLVIMDSQRPCETIAQSLRRAWSWDDSDDAKLQRCHCVVPGHHGSPATCQTTSLGNSYRDRRSWSHIFFLQ